MTHLLSVWQTRAAAGDEERPSFRSTKTPAAAREQSSAPWACRLRTAHAARWWRRWTDTWQSPSPWRHTSAERVTQPPRGSSRPTKAACRQPRKTLRRHNPRRHANPVSTILQKKTTTTTTNNYKLHDKTNCKQHTPIQARSSSSTIDWINSNTR